MNTWSPPALGWRPDQPRNPVAPAIGATPEGNCSTLKLASKPHRPRRRARNSAYVNPLIIVSHRVSRPQSSTAPGGLAVGVLAALRQCGGTWVGWSGTLADEPASSPQVSEDEGIRYATVDLPHSDFDAYYSGFCNGSLWPLCHYFPERFRYDATEYVAYQAINRRIASAVVSLGSVSHPIWVHDYQLVAAGRYLRAEGMNGPIGFFLHIPFPHVEMLRILPVYAELVRDLCQYDLVGFQTEQDLEAFRSAVRDVFGEEAIRAATHVVADGRKVGVGVFPIGVDVDAIAAQAAEAQSDDQVQRLVAGLLGRKLLLGVDRLDYSKGLVERFTAYRHLLESSPEHLGNITYIQIAPLSRVNVAAYAEIRDALEKAAGHTNGQYADTDWTPVRYLNKDFPHHVLLGFLRCANVCAVTPVRDGMNLVAKEFVAAQDPENPGALVLSNMAGAAHELTDALLVNPYDERAVAAALREALELPLADRRARHAKMLAVLRRNTIRHWHESFVATLRSSSQ
ncbi:MAG: trehalose-6-phosphate synthase [Lysobacterales bacterium]|nr:MAG: trehalose-6-phosphate synthase [Xanthomonadales bacterium]